MAKFDFNSLKDSIAKRNPFKSKAEEDFDDEAGFDDEFVPENTDENEEFYPEDEDSEYIDEDSAGEEEYDDQAYSDEEYPDDDNPDEYYDENSENEAADGYYGDDSADGETFEDDEYADDEYAEDDDLDDYEDDGEDLGYNPDLFNEIRNEGSEEQYDDQYDEYEEYDEYGDEGDEGEEYDENPPVSGKGWFDKIKSILGSNPILLYVLLAVPVLQLFAIWYMWHKGLFDKQKRWILTAIGALFIILWIIIFWPRGGGSNDPINNDPFNGPDFSQNVIAPVTSETPSAPAVTTTPTPESGTDFAGLPTSIPEQNTENTAATYVWIANSGLYYHTTESCPNLGGLNPSKVTIELAKQRGMDPCPQCSGGVDQFSSGDAGTAVTPGSTFYATNGGKWYHSNQTCQGMNGAVAVTEANAVKAGKTACPVCIGYYGTPGGKWYHGYSNCQSMTNAVTKTKAEWEAMGKTACPVCLSGKDTVNINKVPTETQVFATQGGSYFHTKNNCSGMKGASQIGISTAVKYGKTACPTCVKPASIYVFARKDGTYYHTKATCSGMKSASYVTAQTAIKAGKKACPSCNAKNLSGSSASSGNTSAATATKLSGTTTKDTNTYVYATKAGKYCHTNSTCSGMTGAVRVTIQTAINAGKKACPTCFKAGNVNVFATTTGKYYHTKSNCSGMTKPLTVTVTKAKNAGKTACPTCAKQLGSLFDKKTTTNTNNNNNNTNTNSNSASASSVVYIKTGSGAGAYYHKAAKCTGQGFAEGTSVTLEYALSKGYKACPSCKPPSKIST